jgi:SH3-like domain-containing protein
MNRAIFSIFLLTASILACTVTFQPATPPTPLATTPKIFVSHVNPRPVPTPIIVAHVLATTLNIRTSSTYHSSATAKYLHAGDPVTILDCIDGWVKVAKTDTTPEGWVNSYFLSRGCK